MNAISDSATKAHLLSDDALEIIAARFRVLGEPSRLKLIRALLASEKSVGQLTEATHLTQANTSRHLQTLTDAGILGRRKEGLSVIYFIADHSILELCQHVCGVVQRRHASHAETLRPGAEEASRFGDRQPPLKSGTRRTFRALPVSSQAAASAETDQQSDNGTFRVSFD